MIITYTPDDAEPQMWNFKPDRMLATEAEAIEKKTGLRFAEWAEALQHGSAIALRAMLWILLKRTEPTLQFGDVDFALGSLGLDLDEDEKRTARDALNADIDMSDEDKQKMLDYLGEDDDAETDPTVPTAT